MWLEFGSKVKVGKRFGSFLYRIDFGSFGIGGEWRVRGDLLVVWG